MNFLIATSTFPYCNSKNLLVNWVKCLLYKFYGSRLIGNETLDKVVHHFTWFSSTPYNNPLSLVLNAALLNTSIITGNKNGVHVH